MPRPLTPGLVASTLLPISGGAPRTQRARTLRTMNVLYIYQADWPKNSTRVAKQTRSLALAGHRVWLLAGNPRRSARRERNAWMEIRRLPAPPGPLLRRLGHL